MFNDQFGRYKGKTIKNDGWGFVHKIVLKTNP